ncbi:MAG: hypothetical protein NT116_05425, partial [Candidatus Parcubacteria bacterium]|nr:hypothetical protein [Candidatus Parcubacteria bacterium]
MTKLKIKIALALAALILLPVVALAQDDILASSSQDTLLEQYLFPVSSYLESGNPIVKAASECDSFYTYDTGANVWGASAICSTLPTISPAIVVKKTGDGKGIYAEGLMGLTYKFSVPQEGSYDFKIKAANSYDNFTNLNNQQLDYIFENSKAATTGYASYHISNDTALNLSVLEYSDDNVITDLNKYDLFKSLIFSVYLDMPAVFADNDKEENYRKGYIIIPATDLAQLQDGSVLLGNLTPGEHTVILRFLSDYFFNFTGLTLPPELNNLSNANLDPGQCVAGDNAAKSCQKDSDCPTSTCNKTDTTLDINPVIAAASMYPTQPTTDVIGIRIYTNKDHKDPETWYQENVIQPATSVKSVKVDGYL